MKYQRGIPEIKETPENNLLPEIVMVQTSLESNDRIEIKSGLNEGDVVVVIGAYLLNSKYIFKKGANPMSGHDMSNM